MASHVLEDNRSRVNIIFKDAAEKMRILDNSDKSKTTLHTFNETPAWFLGIVKVMVQVESYTYLVFFNVMDCLTSDNSIVKRN